MSNLLNHIYWNFVAWYIYPSKFHRLNIHVDYLLKSYIVKIKPEACSSELSWSMLKGWLHELEFQLGEVLENEASEITWLLALIYHHLSSITFKMWFCCSLLNNPVRSPRNMRQMYLPSSYYIFVKKIPLKNLLDDSSIKKQTPEILTSDINRKTKFYLIMCV